MKVLKEAVMRRAFAVLVLIVLASTAGAAQTPAPPATPQAVNLKGGSVSELTGEKAERFFRGLTFTFAQSDLPESVFDSENGIFKPVRDDSLWKTTLSFKMKSMFLSPSDLKDAYGTLADLRAALKVGKLDHDDIGGLTNEELPDYFVRKGGRYRLGRFLSGFSLGASWLERPESDFGSGGKDAADDETKWSFDATFDPAPLFVTAGDRAAAYAAMAAYLKEFPDTRKGIRPLECGAPDGRECLNKTAGLEGGVRQILKRVGAYILPTVKFEMVDEFDYALKSGLPIFFPPEHRDRALQNWEFSWSLSGIMPASQARREAVAAIKARGELNDVIEALNNPAPALKTTALSLSGTGQVAVTLDGGAPGLAWSRKPGQWPLKTLHLTDGGLLVGEARCSGSQTSCVEELGVKITDGAGRKSEGIIKVTIR